MIDIKLKCLKFIHSYITLLFSMVCNYLQSLFCLPLRYSLYFYQFGYYRPFNISFVPGSLDLGIKKKTRTKFSKVFRK